ncbi:hypothetical protein [Candidatus Spongiihabitans sp.]|uniref:hypothetical protein n=1 Tax=Candidatus Spongiihabitans sp. TaxID=3101308 RepID=UPI003C7DAA36
MSCDRHTLTATLIACLLLAASPPSIADNIPFPKTSYEVIGKADALPEQPVAALFVLMDETTKLNQHAKAHRAVQEMTANWMVSGRAVQVIRFSAYVPGREAEIVTGGRLDPEPSDDFIDGMKRSERGKFNKLHKQQVYAAKKQTTAAIRHVFKQYSTSIPKSEILFNMHRLAEHIRKYKAERKVILLVSDMLENSSVTSFYVAGRIRKINPQAELTKVQRKKLIGDFGGNVTVHIIGLGYGAKEYLDSDRLTELKLFWQQYFEMSNAKVVEMGAPLLYRPLE